jgi:uncharacterized protein YecE (DUF72 family)
MNAKEQFPRLWRFTKNLPSWREAKRRRSLLAKKRSFAAISSEGEASQLKLKTKNFELLMASVLHLIMITALNQMAMKSWHIGCSGFYYNHWKGLFYPEDLPKSKWFDFYKERFNTIELNVTFYRFPKLDVFENWYKKSPDDFSFSVKAPRLITHFKQFHDTPPMMAGYYATMREGLKEKLGCVLFQLPPRSVYTPERLDLILETLNPEYRNVLEFRHESWWNEEVYRRLSKNNITFCGMSHPLLPDEVVQNTSVTYYRFHGTPELYKSPYSTAFLKKVSEQIKNNRKTREAFLYFNNDVGGSAIKNAIKLQSLASSKANKKKMLLR